MKRVLIGALLAVSFSVTQVLSEDTTMVAATNVPPPAEKPAKPPKPPKPVVPLETLSLTGKLVKEEVTKKAKNGAESKITVYLLKMEDGTSVRLHPSRPAKGQAAINYDNYVDKQIQVIGPGNKTEKNGKKSISLRNVVSMQEAAAAPAQDAATAAPAVPAATPAVPTPVQDATAVAPAVPPAAPAAVAPKEEKK